MSALKNIARNSATAVTAHLSTIPKEARPGIILIYSGYGLMISGVGYFAGYAAYKGGRGLVQKVRQMAQDKPVNKRKPNRTGRHKDSHLKDASK